MQKVVKIKSKSEFRKYCIKELRFESKKFRRQKSRRVIRNIESILERERFKRVLLYTPLQMEVDIMPLIFKLKKKSSIFVPFMEGVSFKMVKFRLPLFKKSFNILEPSNSYLKEPKLDIAIVPVIGVDRNFKRVGFGRGMYDRFFSRLNYKPTIIFVQLRECIAKESLTNFYDIKGDFLITPNRIFRKV